MGFWDFGGSGTPSPPKPKISKDGTPEAPNRTDRQHCWEARDAFFECLDRNNIIDSIKESKLATEKCQGAEHVFVKNCASTWVHYFKQRRVMEHKKKEALAKIEAEGGQVLPALNNLPPGPR